MPNAAPQRRVTPAQVPRSPPAPGRPPFDRGGEKQEERFAESSGETRRSCYRTKLEQGERRRTRREPNSEGAIAAFPTSGVNETF